MVIFVITSALLFASFFLLALFWAGPVLRWMGRRTRRDARKFAGWADELYVEWPPAYAIRVSLAVNVGLLVLAAATLLLTGSVLFAAAAVVVCYWMPKVVFDTLRGRQLMKLEEQLPDAVNVMVATVRAGGPLAHAVAAVAAKAKHPIRREFEIISNEHERTGLTLEEALDRARRRLKIESFNMICSALIINSTQGGDVLRVLEKMSGSIRELTRLKKKIVTETTEVRAQKNIIILMTPLFTILICLFDPVIPDILFYTVPGNVIVVIVLFVQIIAVMWIRNIVKTAI
jgi:tight adherence protein B